MNLLSVAMIDITPEALEKYAKLPVFWILLGILILIIFLPLFSEIWVTGGPIKKFIGSPKEKLYRLFNKTSSLKKYKPVDIVLSSFNESQFDYDNNYHELYNCKWFYSDRGREEAAIKVIGGDCIYVSGRLYDIPEHYYGFKIFRIIINTSKSNTIFVDITHGKFLPKMLEEIYKISTDKNIVIIHNNKQSEIIDVIKLLKPKSTNINVEFRNYDRYNIIYKKL